MGTALSVLLFESPLSLPFSQQVFQFFLRLIPVKNIVDYLGFNRICKWEGRTFDCGPRPVPGDVKALVDCSMLSFDLCHTHIMKTKTIGDERGQGPRLTVIFFHGGAYVANVMSSHFRGASELIKELSKSHSKQCQIILPEYPLAPRSTCKEMIDMMEKLYRGVEANAKGPIILMGDSAGGGMALLLAQRLAKARREGDKMKGPDGLLLLSPWLDVSVSDPKCAKIEHLDCILKVSFLKEAGASFAGGLDTVDPEVSPLFGDLMGLPPLSVWTSTHDLLLPDAQRLRDRIEGLDDPKPRVRYFEEPGILHDWWMFPFSPACRTIREMANAIVEDCFS